MGFTIKTSKFFPDGEGEPLYSTEKLRTFIMRRVINARLDGDAFQFLMEREVAHTQNLSGAIFTPFLL